MRTVAVFFCLLLGWLGECPAQITAFTSDGRKVQLNDDGTWKYIFETDGKKVILNADGTWRYASAVDSVKAQVQTPAPAQIVQVPKEVTPVKTDTAAVAAVDSVKKATPVPAPKPKPPPNLSCSALVAIQREKAGDKFVAIAKDIMVSEDSKAGFVISLQKTKNTPLAWITTVMGGAGQCVDTENKILIVFKDGGRLQIPNDGKPNCTGMFQLLFGGEAGKEEILETLKNSQVAGIRFVTNKGYVEQQFSEENALRFKAALGCMPK